MPRKIPPDITFDDAEDEVFHSRATVKADPDAADFLPLTDDWLDLIDLARKKDREARVALADANAARVISNNRLDEACTSFGDELYLTVKKDTTVPRWIQFFSNLSISVFIRQRLDKQTNKVRGWLEATGFVDPVLESHRAELDTWNTAAEKAIVATSAVSLVRGTARTAREQMAEDLTRERDGLSEALAERARARDLPREWPSLFFRTETRKKPDAEAPPPPAAKTSDGGATSGG